MIEVVAQSAIIIAGGVLWRLFNPSGLDPILARRVLTGLVYALLLPALVLQVMWGSRVSLATVQIAGFALLGLVTALAASLAWYRHARLPAAQIGALVLAATFPNVTYLGLPVLEHTLGSWARSVAVQYDLFACTPFLLTAGVAVARRYGSNDGEHSAWRALLAIPALWAAAAGLSLNVAGLPPPAWLNGLLSMLAAGVVPLMLISLGLGLTWPENWRHRFKTIIPAVLIQMFLTPVILFAGTALLGIETQLAIAIVLEAAMPSMLLGIVLCDRFGLDTSFYALTVTVTTLLSLATLPFWFYITTMFL